MALYVQLRNLVILCFFVLNTISKQIHTLTYKILPNIKTDLGHLPDNSNGKAFASEVGGK